MAEEKVVLQFSDDCMRGKIFYYADIPDKWYEGDFICLLDSSDILEALNEVASHVSEDAFEDGGPGMSDSFYQVFTRNEAEFKRDLSAKLTELLETTFG